MLCIQRLASILLFLLAEIPTLQVAHRKCVDLLTENEWSPSLKSPLEFGTTIHQAFSEDSPAIPVEAVRKTLGILPDWQTQLIDLL